MCTRDDQFGVLLVGETEPVAVRPVNMRAIYGTPVYRDRPQEQEAGNVHGAASTAVLDPQDVQMHGASYQSSAGSVERMCYIPEKIDEAAFAQFVFPRAGEAAGTEDGRMEAAPTYDQAGQYVLPQQSQSQELEQWCTCWYGEWYCRDG